MNEEKYPMCKDCKHSYCVDAKHNTYYCIPPDGRRSRIIDGRYQFCEKGEKK